ncbi:MAG: o-succinylbenzoate synthase [Actinomycetota bacterium]
MIGLPLVRPFRTSFGEETAKECILVRVETADGAVGWGECVTGPQPDFSGEFNEGAWLVIRDFLTPTLFSAGDVGVIDLDDVFSGVRGNPMAKAALIDAFLDAELRERGESLASRLGAERDRVTCGVSVGITPTTDGLLEQVAGYLDEGYRRIKLKIEPGTDVERVAAVREAHPDILLSVDANAAYQPSDVPVFRQLDRFDLLMVEQPLHYEDIVEHARLQREISSAICLDESIRSASDASAAIELGACRSVNIKPGRVGGVMAAKAVHDVCVERDVPVWCGGMLETGIGRATNLALAALPGFTLPGDTSGSRRYFTDDITDPFELATDGTMGVPSGPGIGVEPRLERLDACTHRVERIEKE